MSSIAASLRTALIHPKLSGGFDCESFLKSCIGSLRVRIGVRRIYFREVFSWQKFEAPARFLPDFDFSCRLQHRRLPNQDAGLVASFAAGENFTGGFVGRAGEGATHRAPPPATPRDFRKTRWPRRWIDRNSHARASRSNWPLEVRMFGIKIVAGAGVETSPRFNFSISLNK